jgi:hypothetical protein
MDPFYMGLGFTALAFLTGLTVGARSSDTSAMTGGFTGAYLGFMASFPLIALGLANAAG